MEERKIRVAITQGDTNGVGYEVILKVFSDPNILELCTPIIYGSPKIASYHRKALNLEVPYTIINHAEEARDGRVNLLACFDDEIKIEIGQPSQEAGAAALKALDRAMTDYRSELYDVLVTAPINKATIQSPGFHFPGHTEYIETSVGEGQKALMILMNETLRVALVTTHLPIKDIAKAIEKDIILPAIEELADKGIQAFGPFAADGFFGSGAYDRFDGVLAMYHDQGLAPFKTIALESGVNYTAGLPIVRTSPDHGTAYDIAGKGIADENSMRQAIFTAIDVFRNRQFYDEPLQNPLPKLFHEKREDGDKARFARPKDMFRKEKEDAENEQGEPSADKKTATES